MTNNDVYRAVHRAGGPTRVAIHLKVSTQSVHRWMVSGVIPKFDKAEALAKLSKVEVENLRPTYSARRFSSMGVL